MPFLDHSTFQLPDASVQDAAVTDNVLEPRSVSHRDGHTSCEYVL